MVHKIPLLKKLIINYFLLYCATRSQNTRKLIEIRTCFMDCPRKPKILTAREFKKYVSNLCDIFKIPK